MAGLTSIELGEIEFVWSAPSGKLHDIVNVCFWFPRRATEDLDVQNPASF